MSKGVWAQYRISVAHLAILVVLGHVGREGVGVDVHQRTLWLRLPFLCGEEVLVCCLWWNFVARVRNNSCTRALPPRWFIAVVNLAVCLQCGI